MFADGNGSDPYSVIVTKRDEKGELSGKYFLRFGDRIGLLGGARFGLCVLEEGTTKKIVPRVGLPCLDDLLYDPPLSVQYS